VIRTGIVLPTFRDSPDVALEAAADAFAAGVDGVFCYDHLWPMGQRERPAMAPFPILATIASTSAAAKENGGPFVGTLVARVGLVPISVLARQFLALEGMAPGRVIAALGTGDRLSEAENRAYGIPYPSAAERRADMVTLARTLRQEGLAVWLAGGPSARDIEAREAGVAMNLWDAPPALVAASGDQPDAPEVTWAGPPPGSEESLHQTVREVAAAGATWAVFGWPVNPGQLVAAAQASSLGR
jgi:alkanesulfonate monooxygenase SsuD/methylene tetrahydromethanopterin reductase-like flavin-dependent oxidoreductase (luciferase family)